VAERYYSGDKYGQVTVREGFIVADGANRTRLDPRFDLHRYPAANFSWSGDGPGQLQLALALLANALGDDERALRFHLDFNRRVVSIFPDRWTITRTRVVAHINTIELRQLELVHAQQVITRLDAYSRPDRTRDGLPYDER
jgi:Family of unknown function (DUF6166)